MSQESNERDRGREPRSETIAEAHKLELKLKELPRYQSFKRHLEEFKSTKVSRTQHDVFHPADALFTDHRQMMWYCYDIGGAPLLAEYLYNYAKYQNAEWRKKPGRTDNRSWMHFINDERGDQILPFLITIMAPDVVRGMIKNNLIGHLLHHAGDDANGGSEEWNKAKKEALRAASVPSSTPGIYFNQFYHTGHDPTLAQASPDDSFREGKGFTIEELQKLVDYIDEYRRNKSFSDRIDKKIKATLEDHSNDPNYRRYMSTDEAKTAIQEWQKSTRETINRARTQVPGRTAKEHQDLLETALLPCLSHAGWGSQTANRTLAHRENENTGKLFGLLNAIIRDKFPSFRMEGVQVLYLVVEKHANLAECLCHVLASTYSWQGGLNGKLAGGLGAKTDPAEKLRFEEGLENNIKWLFGMQQSRALQLGFEHNATRIQHLEEWNDAEKKYDMNVKCQAVSQLVATTEEQLARYEIHAKAVDMKYMTHKIRTMFEKMLTSCTEAVRRKNIRIKTESASNSSKGSPAVAVKEEGSDSGDEAMLQ